ncbi:unnamed protein product, partial [Effrenium voratum]
AILAQVGIYQLVQLPRSEAIMLAKAPAGIVAPVPAPVPAPVAPVPTGRQGAANAPWKLLGFSAVAFQMRHWYSPRRLHMRRALPASSKPQPEGPSQTRRKTLTAGIGCLGAYGYQTRSEASDSRLIYHITEETLPSKVNLPTEAFPHELANDCDVVILGEHHNSASDHSMEADFAAAFIQQQKRRTGMAPAIGLEMVEQPFQAVLDSFGRGELMVKDLYDATEWSKRWVWPFELYAPIFEAAQRLGAPLVALNPATEVRRKLPVEGLRALTTEERGGLVGVRGGLDEAVGRWSLS